MVPKLWSWAFRGESSVVHLGDILREMWRLIKYRTKREWFEDKGTENGHYIDLGTGIWNQWQLKKKWEIRNVNHHIQNRCKIILGTDDLGHMLKENFYNRDKFCNITLKMKTIYGYTLKQNTLT